MDCPKFREDGDICRFIDQAESKGRIKVVDAYGEFELNGRELSDVVADLSNIEGWCEENEHWERMFVSMEGGCLSVLGVRDPTAEEMEWIEWRKQHGDPLGAERELSIETSNVEHETPIFSLATED